MNQFVLIFTLCVALAAGLPSHRNLNKPQVDYSTRIGNVGLAAAGQFPWHALLLLNDAQYWNGALIHPSWVLSSGTSIASNLVQYVDVRLGGLTTDEFEIAINATQFILHEGYDSDTISNDIGLIYLGESVTLSDNVQLIGLSTLYLEPGVTVTVSGFGMDAYFEGNGVLRFGEMLTWTQEQCAMVYGSDVVHEETVCGFSAEQGNLCLGDFGAPLVLDAGTENATLAALSTFIGTYDCPNRYPSGFVRVSPYVDWINNNIRTYAVK